ncbi:hypothetical protein JYT83_01155, partial [bacterium AH-315-F18]|nr:hypothetical protein [bacterium AH-315-F18]
YSEDEIDPSDLFFKPPLTAPVDPNTTFNEERDLPEGLHPSGNPFLRTVELPASMLLRGVPYNKATTVSFTPPEGKSIVLGQVSRGPAAEGVDTTPQTVRSMKPVYDRIAEDVAAGKPLVIRTFIAPDKDKLPWRLDKFAFGTASSHNIGTRLSADGKPLKGRVPTGVVRVFQKAAGVQIRGVTRDPMVVAGYPVEGWEEVSGNTTSTRLNYVFKKEIKLADLPENSVWRKKYGLDKRAPGGVMTVVFMLDGDRKIKSITEGGYNGSYNIFTDFSRALYRTDEQNVVVAGQTVAPQLTLYNGHLLNAYETIREEYIQARRDGVLDDRPKGMGFINCRSIQNNAPYAINGAQDHFIMGTRTSAAPEGYQLFAMIEALVGGGDTGDVDEAAEGLLDAPNDAFRQFHPGTSERWNMFDGAHRSTFAKSLHPQTLDTDGDGLVDGIDPEVLIPNAVTRGPGDISSSKLSVQTSDGRVLTYDFSEVDYNIVDAVQGGLPPHGQFVKPAVAGTLPGALVSPVSAQPETGGSTDGLIRTLRESTGNQ